MSVLTLRLPCPSPVSSKTWDAHRHRPNSRKFGACARYQRYLPDLKCRLQSAKPFMRAAFDMAYGLGGGRGGKGTP